MTTDTKLEGAALNEALARALGYWREQAPDDVRSMLFGKTWPQSPDTLWVNPEGYWCRDGLPDWRNDPATAVELATELQMSGYLVEITMDHDMTVTCIITNGETLGKATRDTLPEAVAVAALSALGAGEASDG